MWKRVELAFILMALLFLGFLRFFGGIPMTGFTILEGGTGDVNEQKFFLVGAVMVAGAVALYIAKFLHSSHLKMRKVGSGRNRISVQRRLLKLKI